MPLYVMQAGAVRLPQTISKSDDTEIAVVPTTGGYFSRLYDNHANIKRVISKIKKIISKVVIVSPPFGG